MDAFILLQVLSLNILRVYGKTALTIVSKNVSKRLHEYHTPRIETWSVR